MDQIRKALADRMQERGVSMAELSRRLGRNHAYIQQFVSGKQQNIPYEERIFIAEYLEMKPQLLGVAEKQQPKRDHAPGFAEDAVPYVPPRGHFLSATPEHFWMLRQTSNSLDQHSENIRKGDVLVFDLNLNDPAKIPPMKIVAVQLCARDELTKSLGTATRMFIPPNKLITNSSEWNEIFGLDDDSLPFVPVLRGTFLSVIRELN